ncbi:MAG: D-alanyl-D-alanine carboxypeptidase family protein, partial [Romboutsia sp.]|uniref:D-alanyl-D-alanine carboxypeptidase family protein n=1 Tax=Romboutsia sp. TaxID=1965302 RepID=UPI003F31E9A5
MKKNISLLVAFLMIFTFILSNTGKSFANNTKLDLTAQYAVLMDYETGQVLYGKNRNTKLYPASTTKIWVAHVVLKHVPDLNQVIEIKDLPPIEGSSMYLKNGESFTVKELLDSLLIHSSNDAGYVLAKYVSGSVEAFCDLMNKEAKDIGAKNTHFNNPHGLPDVNHYTTAYDMALMSREAMSNEIFRSIVKTNSLSFEATEAYPYSRIFKNTNKFLNSNDKINYKGKDIDIKYDIIDGIKTGYTDDAGRCLVSSGVKNNMRLISAVFKSNGNNLYLDSRTLLDYGFDNFTTTTIVNKDEYIDSKRILLSKQGELLYEPEY